MCGIFGITSEEIDSGPALDSLAHRGPDDFGEWRGGGVTLVQTRLSIIDLSSGGHQPMLSEGGRFSIIFNGEIYNYAHLKKDLLDIGVNFKSNSDTEVILKGFEKEGQAFFSKLRGMWSIAVFDKEQRILTLARDPFGIKPLLFSWNEGRLVFASNLKTLKKYVSTLSLNTPDYFLFYNLGYFPGDRTLFKEIKKVLPGQILNFDLNNKKLTSKFVDLPSRRGEIVDPIKASEILQESLLDSVKHHFVSDVSVGLLLSGGNDSTFLAALAKELGQKPTCFNVAIQGSEDNKYADKIAGYLGLPFEKIPVSLMDFANQYREVLEILDEPTSDVSFVPTALVYKKINGKSKVVLSGEGGDELFGGYLRHRSFADLSQMSFTNFFPDLSGLAKSDLTLVNPLFNRLRDWAAGFESLGERYVYKSHQLDLNIKLKDTLHFLENYYTNHPYRDLVQSNLFFDLFMYLPGALMYKGDTASMAYSIEGRTPFLDKPFFEAVSSIHPELRLSPQFPNKKILKLAMEKYLPKDLIYRKKTGFGINLNNYRETVLPDLRSALDFHIQHKAELGVIDSGLEKVFKKENAEIILRKYPRFAFALITNWRVVKKYR